MFPVMRDGENAVIYGPFRVRKEDDSSRARVEANPWPAWATRLPPFWNSTSFSPWMDGGIWLVDVGLDAETENARRGLVIVIDRNRTPNLFHRVSFLHETSSVLTNGGWAMVSSLLIGPGGELFEIPIEFLNRGWDQNVIHGFLLSPRGLVIRYDGKVFGPDGMKEDVFSLSDLRSFLGSAGHLSPSIHMLGCDDDAIWWAFSESARDPGRSRVTVAVQRGKRFEPILSSAGNGQWISNAYPLADGGWALLVREGPGDLPILHYRIPGTDDVKTHMMDREAIIHDVFWIPDIGPGVFWSFRTETRESGRLVESEYHHRLELIGEGFSVQADLYRQAGGMPVPTRWLVIRDEDGGWNAVLYAGSEIRGAPRGVLNTWEIERMTGLTDLPYDPYFLHFSGESFGVTVAFVQEAARVFLWKIRGGEVRIVKDVSVRTMSWKCSDVICRPGLVHFTLHHPGVQVSVTENVIRLNQVD